jgi:hypothetical protein
MAGIEPASIGVVVTIPSSSFFVSPVNVPYPAERVSVTRSLDRPCHHSAISCYPTLSESSEVLPVRNGYVFVLVTQ